MALQEEPMGHRRLISSALIGSLALAPLAGLTGCSNLPGNSKEQGAVIGGVGGALAGAALGGRADNKGALGALIGGVVGAGGGYLIGAQKDKVDKKKRDEAVAAHRRAEQNPAKAEDVENARTADLNEDGFVTLDEVVAMERANLSDREMVERLDRTGQVFELTEDQERYLQDRGVSREVIAEMRRMRGADDSEFARTASAGNNDDYQADELRQTEATRRDEARGRDEQPKDFERYREGDRYDRF
jgi:Glycine zipper